MWRKLILIVLTLLLIGIASSRFLFPSLQNCGTNLLIRTLAATPLTARPC